MGKYSNHKLHYAPMVLIPLCYYLIEVFSLLFLGMDSRWPLTFGGFWALLLTGMVLLLPGKALRWGFAGTYFFFLAYAVVQTGYYLLFGEMMWFDDFRYASEGSDYFDILLSYPLSWWGCIAFLVGLGVLMACVLPAPRSDWLRVVIAAALIAYGINGAVTTPEKVFTQDKGVRYAGSDYGRAQSQQAAYENMFNAHRLYKVCGIYQTAIKDLYTHHLYPLTPGYQQALQESRQVVDDYFQAQKTPEPNEMTGLLKDKNVILVLMESMDDWMIGEHTPTLSKLMNESINFTRFYTPGFGGIRTFNTEFCINTGSFLSSQGGYAFDYVTNSFDQSLANLLKQQGYSPLTFHYNDPSFYSRGVFSEALGYDAYVSYQDYVGADSEELYNEELVFDNDFLRDLFFREGKKLNFVITRSAHLSYKYNEVLSYRALKKYPEYRGLTGNEETDCALVKARLVDDFFDRMLRELAAHDELENTVIIGITDHYTYGYKDMESLLSLSVVAHELLLEKVPCFIWSADLPAMEVDKVLNTSDLLPTVLNLLGTESPYDYMGSDAFDPRYDGFVPFSDGSWILGDIAFQAGTKQYLSISGKTDHVPDGLPDAMSQRISDFIQINNQILKTDYYAK